MPKKILLIAAFVANVYLANWALHTFGLLSVGGLAFSSGALFAGASFTFRDFIDDRRLVFLAIAIGALVSFHLSGALAVASGTAFAISETADWIVYEPIRRRGFVRAVFFSGLVGSLVDTVVFLHLAGFGLAAPLVTGQIAAKWGITALFSALLYGGRVAGGQRRTPALVG